MTCTQSSFGAMDSLPDILGTLSNQKRRQILGVCLGRHLTLEHISKNIDTSIAATKKHLALLQNANLLEKDSAKRFATTQIGEVFLQKLNSFEFLSRHKDFFANHRFGDLTPSMINRIGNLKNCEFYFGFHIVLPKWSKIITGAREYLNLVFLHPPIVIADYIKPQMSSIQIRLAIGKNSRITECNEFVDKLELYKPASNACFEKRRCDKVQVNLIMSEKEACIIFPNNDGITDMHGNFISNEPDFINLCRDFFDHKWKYAEPISRLR